MSTEGEFSFFLASLASGGDNPAGRESDLICIGPAPSNAGSSSATTGKNSGSGDAGNRRAALCSAAEREGLEDLIAFLESRASRGGSRGSVRKIEKQGDHHLRFHITNNRFCERISRQHKSNHVFYVVDARNRTYTQGCMDLECRGYWAPDRPIPEACTFDCGLFLRGSNRENEATPVLANVAL